MAAKCNWIIIMVCAFSSGCLSHPQKRLLSTGGTHVFESQSACSLVHAQPANAIKDLGWKDKLAFETVSEGSAEVACGDETTLLQIIAPAKMAISIVDGSRPTEIIAGRDYAIQARLYDRRERELEVGELTRLDWHASGMIEIAPDRSAGEFGFCDTCFGMQRIRAVKAGKGVIEVRLGNLQAKLAVMVIEATNQTQDREHG